MSWYIVICAAFLTVNIFGHGQTSGKELPTEKVSDTIKDINIPESDNSVFDLNVTLNTHGFQADNAHFRRVRSVGINNNETREVSASDISNQIFATLNSLKTNMTAVELAKRFWCRINVTRISDIDDKVLLEALSLMDKDIKTCPLKMDNDLIVQVVKLLTEDKLPKPIDILAIINKTLHLLLTPEDIEEINNSTGGIIFLALEKMTSYFEKNPQDSIFKMLGRQLCTIDKVDLSKLSAQTFIDIIKNVDKTKCSEQQQKIILEKFVQMFSIRQWLDPKYIFGLFKSDFFKSDIFQMYKNMIRISDEEWTTFRNLVVTIDELKIVDWSVTKVGERFLCHLDETNITKIDWKVLGTTMGNMLKTPKCSQDVLKTKWKELITSFIDMLTGLLLPTVEDVAKEINKIPDGIMEGLREVNWTTVKIEILKAANMINGIADNIITNVNGSKEKNWTLEGLFKNFVCGLNITDFSKVDDKFPEKMIGIIGKLDICTEVEQEAAWDTLLQITAKMNSKNLMEVLPHINDSIKMSDILKHVKDEHIESIKSAIKSILKVEGLDTLLGYVWKNMKTNPNQELSVVYILEFMACNVKPSDITTLNATKIMSIATKFGLPVKCNTPIGDWLTNSMKVVMKQMSEMGFKQLGQLDRAIGRFTTQDLKNIANGAKKLKDLAMASLNKVAKKSEDWITYLNENGTLNISTVAGHLVCFFAKGDFSSLEKTIVSLGEFGQCTKADRIKLTDDFLNDVTKMNAEGELMKEFLIGIGILSGEINAKKIQAFITKLSGKLNTYLVDFWSSVPKDLKDLTISKVLEMIRGGMAELDQLLQCVVKSIAWPIFGQPNAPDFGRCFHKIKPENPDKVPEVKPGRKPGGSLADRYKVGKDFPFMKMLKDKVTPEKLVEGLLAFTRDPDTEKEGRILDFVTNKGIDYLLSNPKKLEELLSSNKQRILELATKVNRGAQIMSKMKVDSESLAMVKTIGTPQQANKLLRRALKDMEMETKSVTEKKDFIQQLSSDVMMQSGTQLIDKLFSEGTKKVFIQSFIRKRKPQTSKKRIEDDEEEEQSLAKLSLVNKLLDKTPDNETLTMMMNTSLVSVISINMLKKLPQKEMCSMEVETAEMKNDQLQYIVVSCPETVEKIAKSNATSLGKLATKVTKPIVNSLNLKELISLTEVACRYESKLDIDLEKVFKNHFITQKLDPMKNGTSMSCVLKYVTTELPWTKPEAIEICKTLGNSIMKKITQKRANFFKSQCIDLLKKENITFADMGSMNALLEKADIEKLKPEIILQGAVELAIYVWDVPVFNEIGRKLTDLTGFKKRSNLTTDQVAQAGIFIAAWSDAETIPKESVSETFDSIAASVSQLQKKKMQCLKQGKGNKCNVMDDIIAKIVQILIKSMSGTGSRRKRSTASCRCANLVNLGVAAVQVPATQLAEMICDTNFDECMEGLSQITDWNQDQRKVFVQKASKVWGEPKSWNSTNVAIASAVIPGLSTDQIKVLALDSMDAIFYIGKQNNWGMSQLTETFTLFLGKLKNNNISSVTSFDLQALGNIVCGIGADKIDLIPKTSYINAASQIGSLAICSQTQLTAWAKKALAVYGDNINNWGLAEISSIGSVISGFSTTDLQKLNEKQIAAISVKTIPKILPEKLASLHPGQIGYLTTSQVQMVTSAQTAQMTEEQKEILQKKVLGASVTDTGKSGGSRIGVNCYFKWTMQLIIFGIFTNPFIWN